MFHYFQCIVLYCIVNVYYYQIVYRGIVLQTDRKTSISLIMFILEEGF